MTHAEQTADGLATWIERRQHTPAELRQILRLALQDAEARGARLASLEAPPDPLPEPAAPLNAHVGRRRAGAYFTIDRPADGGTVGVEREEAERAAWADHQELAKQIKEAA